MKNIKKIDRFDNDVGYNKYPLSECVGKVTLRKNTNPELVGKLMDSKIFPHTLIVDGVKV